MLKILPIILSRISQNFHPLFIFFILVSSLLFQTNSHLVSVVSHISFQDADLSSFPELINGHK